MKAVILAAGEQSKLRQLTNHWPKPMLSDENKPLLESVIESIATAGVSEVVLVVGYHHKQIQNHFGDGNHRNVNITYAVQEKHLGTGHAFLQAEPYIETDFIAVNGDRNIKSQVVEDLINEHRQVTVGGLVGNNACLGENVTMKSGTIIDEGVTADSVAAVSGQIGDGAVVQRG